VANGHSMPDLHGGATVEAAAFATVLIWVIGMAGVTVPGDVGAAIATLCAVAFGLARGSRYSRQRRHGDPDPGSSTEAPSEGGG